MPESVKSFGSSTFTDDEYNSNFASRYENMCKHYHTQPLKDVKQGLSHNVLNFIGDRIKYDDWIPLLKAIKGDRQLHYIAIRSRHSSSVVVLEHINTERKVRELAKGSVLFTKYLLLKIMEAFSECIKNSCSLMCFQLQRIPLKSEALTLLTEALKLTTSLQHLSLQHSKIGDSGCKELTRAIRNTTNLISLDLTDCELTDDSASYISELIKAQEIARYGESWKHSLRYREVPTELIPGLRRISLTNNPDIGDKGLSNIIEVLFDDCWIKAFDLQNCGITDWGCNLILKLLKINKELVIFDVRKNPIIDTSLIARIVQILGTNASEEDKLNYGWIDIRDSDSKLGSSMSSNSICSSRTCNESKSKILSCIPSTKALFDRYLKNCHSTNTLCYRQNNQFIIRRGPLVRSNSSMTFRAKGYASLDNFKNSANPPIISDKKCTPPTIQNYPTRKVATKPSVKPVKALSQVTISQPKALSRQSSLKCLENSYEKKSGIPCSDAITKGNKCNVEMLQHNNSHSGQKNFIPSEYEVINSKKVFVEKKEKVIIKKKVKSPCNQKFHEENNSVDKYSESLLKEKRNWDRNNQNNSNSFAHPKEYFENCKTLSIKQINAQKKNVKTAVDDKFNLFSNQIDLLSSPSSSDMETDFEDYDEGNIKIKKIFKNFIKNSSSIASKNRYTYRKDVQQYRYYRSLAPEIKSNILQPVIVKQ